MDFIILKMENLNDNNNKFYIPDIFYKNYDVPIHYKDYNIFLIDNRSLNILCDISKFGRQTRIKKKIFLIIENGVNKYSNFLFPIESYYNNHHRVKLVSDAITQNYGSIQHYTQQLLKELNIYSGVNCLEAIGITKLNQQNPIFGNTSIKYGNSLIGGMSLSSKIEIPGICFVFLFNNVNHIPYGIIENLYNTYYYLTDINGKCSAEALFYFLRKPCCNRFSIHGYEVYNGHLEFNDIFIINKDHPLLPRVINNLFIILQDEKQKISKQNEKDIVSNKSLLCNTSEQDSKKKGMYELKTKYLPMFKMISASIIAILVYKLILYLFPKLIEILDTALVFEISKS
ncbi:hypothetical protein TBLA_0A10620 [Henningerozyma blattae CBS 6284]|uniref:Uncharacterized protein n=1 Tax=Henningerozyma blattae (strain ATCC 34711 / CBS 6284 / DSM 70876 / NBRC 10599 / NRRL Y-10934 / UCD 77-7) TaxID=1071380 RepID=I2GXI8_HENB6|nr:hypothetical protein TBLA_0A10620 [Tetrapisispora blattae CBS 6284]CCH58840.1 hypothetical protein TBLA_0A10620 [Tetrapisispora blattae CBS 6284]